MIQGCLVAESLRVGGVLSDVPLRVRKIWRGETTSAAGLQPRCWTLLEFEAADGDADRLAAALAGCLAPEGGWYANFNTSAEAFVVFADRVFRYPRGDPAGRAEATRFARSVGVPEPQLDWAD
jgi:hypothetical protein